MQPRILHPFSTTVLTRPRWALLAVLLATVTAYLPVTDADFVAMDDTTYITGNEHLTRGLTLQGFRWAFTDMGSYDYWRPLTWLSHMVDFTLYGNNAGGHHLTNLIIHLVNVVLVYAALGGLAGNPWVGVGAAALFALHPLHVESVAWVTARKDVLAAFGWFLALVAYARYVRHPSLIQYIAVLLAHALSLMAKPMAVTLPCLLLLLDIWAFGRTTVRENAMCGHSLKRWGWLIAEKIPLVFLSLCSVGATMNSYGTQTSLSDFSAIPFMQRLGNAVLSYGTYMAFMVAPVNLAVYYPYPSSLPMGRVGASLVLLACVTFLVLRTAGRYPYLRIGWLWYIGTLVPVIGLVQTGRQSMADRFVYIPAVGLYLAVADTTMRFFRQHRSRHVIGWSAGSALLLSLAVLTNRQAQYWSDSETLFRHTLNVTEDNAVIHGALGAVLLQQGRHAEAMAHFAEAARIAPHYPDHSLPYGMALVHAGRYRESLPFLWFALARSYRPGIAMLSIAEAYHGLGSETAAERVLQAVVAAEPDSWKVHFAAGNQYYNRGKTAEASACYRRAAALNPHRWEPHALLGTLLLQQERPDSAVDCLLSAVALKPPVGLPYVNAAVACWKIGRYGDAARLLHEALAVEPDNCTLFCSVLGIRQGLGVNDLSLLANGTMSQCKCNGQSF